MTASKDPVQAWRGGVGDVGGLNVVVCVVVGCVVVRRVVVRRVVVRVIVGRLVVVVVPVFPKEE